jgi:predicted RNase H-related nuclease YkuK (DUF458 family)
VLVNTAKIEEDVVRWKSLSGGKVEDLAALVRAATAAGQELHIGTDSLQTGRFTQFVTVVITHTPGKGGRVVYGREVVPRITSLRERLYKEVWRSVEVAMELNPVAGGGVTVHIDANPIEKHMSSRYVQELTGLVMGQGFKHLVKPDAWAASHAADHIVRTKGKLPNGANNLKQVS